LEFLKIKHFLIDLTPKMKRIIAQNDVRALSDPLEKAVFIKMHNKIGYRPLAEYFKISRSSLRRAVKSSKEKRELGRVGRPSIVQSEDEEKLLEVVQQWKEKNGEDISHQELLEQVFL